MREEISYQLIRSARKTIGIQIKRDGSVTVRAPLHCKQSVIEAFLVEKAAWIRRKQAELQSSRQEMVPLTEEEKESYRVRASEIFEKKVSMYASKMNVTIHRITIRDQKTRWGSCSAGGNLNFNWRLLLAPEEVLDYVVVHELAHRKEMNHSSRFWKIVEEFVPDYRTYRQWLRQYGENLMR